MDRGYRALFTSQRKRSLLKRVQETGHINFTLSSANHRAHGDVYEWARGCLYVTDMRTANKRNGYSTMINEWLKKECSISHMQTAEPSTNIVFVNISDGTKLMQASEGQKARPQNEYVHTSSNISTLVIN